jgi:hypothetical protein
MPQRLLELPLGVPRHRVPIFTQPDADGRWDVAIEDGGRPVAPPSSR